MPPPRVPDPAGGTTHALPSAASIPPSRSELSLIFRIDPVVVANIFAHYTRVKDQGARCGENSLRIFGCVLGVQHRQKVDLCNSFELVVDPVSGTFDRAFFEEQQELYKKLFPDFNVRGWYSTGSHVEDTDMEIHRKLLNVNHSAVYLLLNPAINLSQMDLPVTIYESERRVIDRRAQLIFVRPKHKVEVVKKAFSTEAQAPKHPHFEETTSDVIATMPREEGEDAKFKRCAFRRMLIETPSGFAMFGIDDKVFRRPEDIWACFTHLSDAKDVIFTIGFVKVGNKSIAWDTDAGPGEDLGLFILKFCNRKGLIVQDVQLKQVIETELGVPCWFNEHIVPELTWGLNFVLDEFVPEEKENLTDKYYLPLSMELEKKIKTYGFNISKQMIDREFITLVGRLKYLECTSDALFKFLHDRFDYCFPRTGMSETEYIEAIANALSSEPSLVIQDEMYDKEDLLRAIDSFLAVPKQTQYIWSRLRQMKTAANLQEEIFCIIESEAVF